MVVVVVVALEQFVIYGIYADAWSFRLNRETETNEDSKLSIIDPNIHKNIHRFEPQQH